MSLNELLTALVDGANGLVQADGRSETDKAADMADFLRTQAENLTVFLRGKQQRIARRDDCDTNADQFRNAADNLRFAVVAASETVWNLRQVDQRREGVA